MTHDTVVDIAATIAAAQTLLGVADSAAVHAALGTYLDETRQLVPFPDGSDEFPPLMCVDGAVATEQTDTLAWIAAVATDSAGTTVRRKTAVVPVSSALDQVRSAVMALCEMSVAVQLYDSGIDAWMDGGLVTPLLSVAAGLQSADRETSAALCDVLDTVRADVIIDAYIDHATQGAVSALPKQDTASTFCASWSTESELPESARQWLVGRRDRAVTGAVIPPGHLLAARHGSEALRVVAKPPRCSFRRAHQWVGTVEELLADWRDMVTPWVTYAVPHNSSVRRAVKIEFTTIAEASEREVAEQANKRAVQACSGVTGTRIIEPYQQYVVDQSAKSEVRGLLSRLLGQAQVALLGHHPGAVSSFRS